MILFHLVLLVVDMYATEKWCIIIMPRWAEELLWKLMVIFTCKTIIKFDIALNTNTTV